MIKTVSWEPFHGANMTVEQTRKAILWAMAQFGEVSNLKFISSTGGKTADVHIRGKNTNDWAGYAIGKNIWISTQRNLSARDGFILGAVTIHEIGHTIGWKHTPQTSEYRNHAMHPWASAWDWFGGSEIVKAQKTWGKPTEQFFIHPIIYLGNILRAKRATIALLIKARNNLWKQHDEAKPSERPAIIEKIEVQNGKISVLQNAAAATRGERARRIEIWAKAKVPKAIVPELVASELALADDTIEHSPRNMVVCGNDLPNVMAMPEPDDDTGQEPIE
jgi:hypothetical protein